MVQPKVTVKTLRERERKAAEPKPKRTRSRTQRLESVDDLVLALKTGSLDNRTRTAQELVQTRAAIAADPTAAAKSLITDTLAVSACILSALAAEIAKPDNLLVNGRPNELITKHFYQVQASILKAVSTLNSLNRGQQPDEDKASTQPIDISTLILEANRQ